MRKLEARVPPPVLTVAIAALMWAGLQLVAPAPFPPEVGYTGAALSFLLAGLFGFPALRAFQQAGTTINPVQVGRASALVTEGVYRWTRNPMYVSLTLLLVCWAFLLADIAAFVGPLFFLLWINRLQIVPEERAMAARFGADYEDYRQRVRRWV